MFSNNDRTDMILFIHYFCDFNCLLLLLNHILLKEVLFCQTLTFIRLTVKSLIGIEIALLIVFWVAFLPEARHLT
jgi:hypothetical protein